jgi:hypothetical protein
MAPQSIPPPDRRPDVTSPHDEECEKRAGAAEEHDVVEQASEDSFPASDAPSWTPLTSLGPPPNHCLEDGPEHG